MNQFMCLKPEERESDFLSFPSPLAPRPSELTRKKFMSLKLYFLRHGETIYSKTGGYCGDLDPELTPEGMQMAEAVATAYRSLSWTAVFASPMKRTIATAKPLCNAVGLEMQLRDGLKEISYGKWEDKTVEFVKQNYPDDYVRWLTEPAWNPPTGGETAVEVASRAMPVIAEIEDQYPTGNVLVVSHKATLRIILCSLLGIDMGRYRDRITALAASISIVKFDAHGPLLEVLGDRYHLPEHLLALPGT
jgi:probable phosphoglycerate mutase